MAELRAPEQNILLGRLANMLRATEGDIAAPEFLPRELDVMGLVRQLMLPSAETVEKLSYGDPLFRMPTQSNIPITADREYLAEVLGMAPAVPAASRATTRLSNEAADRLVRAITRNPEATAPAVLEAAGQMLPLSKMISPEVAAKAIPDTKVVDEAGNPKILYHGTSKEFDEFVVPEGKRASFFTTNPEFANEYAKFRGGNVVPVYIDAKKPWDYENPKDMKEFQKFLGLTDEEVELPQGFDEGEQYLAASNGQWDFIESDEFQGFLKQKGYDAFYVKENGVKNLGVFEPKQIKSAVSDPQMAGLLDQPAQSVVETSYRGSHSAPNAETYGATLDSLEGIMPADVYSSRGKRLYGLGNPDVDAEWFAAAFKAKGKPDAEVTVYRAVPKGVKEINSGDWVTTSKTYADMHGENTVGDEYEILSKKVKAKTLSSEGYPYEFGYNE